jgi:hypothetical protein
VSNTTGDRLGLDLELEADVDIAVRAHV